MIKAPIVSSHDTYVVNDASAVQYDAESPHLVSSELEPGEGSQTLVVLVASAKVVVEAYTDCLYLPKMLEVVWRVMA